VAATGIGFPNLSPCIHQSVDLSLKVIIIMMVEQQDRFPLSAWGVSFAVHGLALCVAFVLAMQVQPIIKEDIFQWDVALVQPVSEPPQTESALAPAVQPSKPAPVRTVQTPQPVEPASDMVMARVAPQEAVKPEPVREIVQPKAHPAPVAKEVAPPVESVATAQAYEPPAPSHAHRAESAPVIHHESPSPEEMAPEWRPLVAVKEGAAKAVTESPVSSSVPAAVESTAVAAAPVQAQAPAPLVAKAAPVPSATKADSAWLAESLGRRIKELTRYPSSARLNGSEGKVVLRVILRADGHLSDVTVHRSSGHEVLDRAAMETVRLACPIHMKQALSAAEVAVYVPIVYSLAG